MRFELDGETIFAGTGGRAHVAGRPLIVFLHGAGMDHTVWALPARRFAWAGANVAAVDLPGHGASAGAPLAAIGAAADWLARAISALGADQAVVVGHSMGALIALDAAARHPDRIAGLGLVGAAAAMPVHPDMLTAAAENRHDAIDMVGLWGLGAHATLGGSPVPGQWMLGGTLRLLERAAPGVLHTDLAACDAYEHGAHAAAAVRAPTAVVLGERDQMTPVKAGRALAGLIPGARTTVVPGAGHMLMLESPDELIAALAPLAAA